MNKQHFEDQIAMSITHEDFLDIKNHKETYLKIENSIFIEALQKLNKFKITFYIDGMVDLYSSSRTQQFQTTELFFDFMRRLYAI